MLDENIIGTFKLRSRFRAAHHSDLLEIELGRRNIPFVKYGGLKFLEAAHVKDVLAILRWAENPRDAVAGFRALQLQWPRSPRSHPKNPRFSNSVSSRSVFARRCSRDTATLEGWMTCASHAHSANAPTRSRRGRLRRQAQS